MANPTPKLTVRTSQDYAAALARHAELQKKRRPAPPDSGYTFGVTHDIVKALGDGGIPADQVAKAIGVSLSTLQGMSVDLLLGNLENAAHTREAHEAVAVAKAVAGAGHYDPNQPRDWH